jgi:RNA polymerase sigma-70 factor (ECF subfamily)
MAMTERELLQHVEFVRRLAHSLVGDAHGAEDVAQETWVAALRAPHGELASAPSWLARVTRNFAHMMHRGEHRRRRRERRAAALETTPTPAELVAQGEEGQRLSAAVLALDEPYRTVILYRFYRGLGPREIAARLGVPIDTVKTRLRRGLERLRVDFGCGHGHPRRAAQHALTALAAWRLSGPGATLPAPATLTLGGALMTTAHKSILALTACLLLVATVTTWCLEGDPDPAVAPAASQVAVPPSRSKSVAAPDGPAPAVAPRDGAEPVREAVTWTGMSIGGRVVDAATRAPVPRFVAQLTRQLPRRGSEVVGRQSVEDPDGVFAFALERSGTYDLRVSSPDHRVVDLPDLAVEPGVALRDLVVVLDPGTTVTGRVVDDADGQPIAGAVVGPATLPGETRLALLVVGRGDECHHAVTDPTGRFRLGGLHSEARQRLAAVHPEYAEGYAWARVGSGNEVEIRLPRGFRIRGTVRASDGSPVAGALIGMAGPETPLARAALTAADGTYETPPTRPGPVHLRAGPPPGVAAAALGVDPEVRSVVVRDRDLVVDFGPSPDLLRWTGRVLDVDGTPIAYARITLFPDGMSKLDGLLYAVQRRTECDARGRFELTQLVPGRYDVTLFCPAAAGPRGGLGSGSLTDLGVVELGRPGALERDLQLTGGVISGVVVDGMTGRALAVERGGVTARAPAPSGKVHMAPVDVAGRFRITGLEPGSYRLSARLGLRHVDGVFVDDHAVTAIELPPGGVVTGVRIVTSHAGKLRLHVDSLADRAGHAIELVLVGATGAEVVEADARLDGGGSFRRTRSLAPGPWTLLLRFADGAYLERAFAIRRGETTEVTVGRGLLDLSPRSLTIAGVVVAVDGEPIEGAEIAFVAVAGDRAPAAVGRSGAGGRYRVAGLRVGFWRPRVTFADGSLVHLERVHLPPTAADPHRVDLTLPAGAIHGGVAAPVAEWTAALVAVGSGRVVGSASGTGAASRFRLRGIPDGDYALRVMAPGHRPQRLERLRIGPARRLDLAPILLAPAAILELEVVDERSLPVETFTIFHDGAALPAAFGRRVGSGRRAYDSFPAGRLTLRVAAPGHAAYDIAVDLVTGRVTRARAVLRAQ